MSTRINLRVLIAVIAGVLVLALLNWNIFKRERLIEHGRIVFLQLASADPRFDYMALNYVLVDLLEHYELKNEGMLVLTLDEKNIARLSSVATANTAIRRQDDQVFLRYRARGVGRDRVKVATNAFFFEKGQWEIYEPARYGEFRVDDSGNAILIQLRDEQLNVLGRSAVLN